MIERRLEHMGETHEVVEAEGAGAALDRMHRAKHGVDRLGIGVAVFHGEKPALQFGELLLAFLEEGLP